MRHSLTVILAIMFFTAIGGFFAYNLLQGILHGELPVIRSRSDEWVSFSEAPLRFTFSLLMHLACSTLLALGPYGLWRYLTLLKKHKGQMNTPGFEDSQPPHHSAE